MDEKKSIWSIDTANKKRLYDQQLIYFKKGDREKAQMHAASKGYRSFNKYMMDLIERDMQQGKDDGQ